MTRPAHTLQIAGGPIGAGAFCLIDPSRAAGRRELVGPLSLAAAAVGADGIIVEVHPDPEHAVCDGRQSLATADFAAYATQVAAAAALHGRTLTSLAGACA